jgi:hypothetical protein
MGGSRETKDGLELEGNIRDESEKNACFINTASRLAGEQYTA